MKILKEFKDFAMRGNIIDMAIGVIIGSAFGKIVSSFVENIIMPPIGLLMGGIDLSNFFIPLSSTPVSTLAEAKALGVPVMAIGLFFNSAIDFLIIAFCIFFTLTQINKFLPKKAPEKKFNCEYCKEPINEQATRCPHCTAQLTK